MIFVERERVGLPPRARERLERELHRATEFFRVPEELRRRDRFDFRAPALRDLRMALDELFHSKCAFCETRATAGRLDTYWFRPRRGVVRENGDLLPDHYWWLAYDWRNIYSACAACGRAAPARGHTGGVGGRFPLDDEWTRAEVGEPYELVLQRERPLLLDPCNDRPDEHLLFDLDGSVSARTERGSATISAFTLDRPELVAARKRVGDLMEAYAMRIAGIRGRFSGRAERAALQALTGDDQEYAGAARQFAAQLNMEHDLGLPFAERAPDRRERIVLQQQSEELVAQESRYSLAQPSDVDEAQFRKVTRRIERIRLHNIRAVRDLDIDLRRSTAPTAPWCVLLGENGSGKSTVLQAVALALIGQEELERLEISPARFLRDRARRGLIEVHVSGSSAPRVVEMTADEFDLSAAAVPQMPVIGYGETRLPPAPDLPPAVGSRANRVDGLFRPARTLMDAQAALLEQPDATFEYVARAFSELLAVDNRWLQRDRSKVWVVEAGQRRPIDELSTGYQAVVATVVDILELLLRFWPDPDHAEGVVLLDELGAHLHPTWRLRVVNGLRRMLPQVQFLATTHEPLCLRGLEEHEVVLMVRSDGAAVAEVDLPNPRDLRVDQLLTSRHFGLSSTLDPELDAQFQRYYDLLGRRAHLALDEANDLERLARQLRGHGVLGDTRRDQLAYEAIDRFLADEQNPERRSPAPADRTQVLREIGDLWRVAKLAEGQDDDEDDAEPDGSA